MYVCMYVCMYVLLLFRSRDAHRLHERLWCVVTVLYYTILSLSGAQSLLQQIRPGVDAFFFCLMFITSHVYLVFITLQHVPH